MPSTSSRSVADPVPLAPASRPKPGQPPRTAQASRSHPEGEPLAPDLRARLRGWAVPGAALLAAVAATLGLAWLLHQGDAHRGALKPLAAIERQASLEQVALQRAVSERRPDPEVLDQARAARRPVAAALEELARLEASLALADRLVGAGLAGTAAGLRAAVQARHAGTDEALGHAMAGRLDQARAVEPAGGRARAEALRAALDGATTAYDRFGTRLRRAAARAGALALALAATAVGWLGIRLGRVRRTAERLAGEQRALQASEERFRSLVQHAADVIAVLEVDSTIRHISPAVRSALGYSPEHLVGTNGWALVNQSDAASAQAFHAELLEQPGKSLSVELRWQHRDGSWRYLEVKGTNLLQQPGVRGIVLNARDITQHKALEQQLVQRALHDQLTGLPNRLLFMDRLEHALLRSARHRKFVGVLFLDLDRFKLVNDNFGHDRGDQLLVAAAQRLRGCLRRVDTIARLGGDEFTVLLDELGGTPDAVRVGERIIEALRDPFKLEGQEVFVGASIGIALGTSDQGASSHGLLRNADVAMYRAKANGRARFEVFHPSMREMARGRIRIETELRHALDRGELRVHYQPKVDLRSGRIVGLEALVRWQHPERGLVPPGSFIPIAEETGLIMPLGRWVLEVACHQASRWRASGGIDPELVMAVNLAPQQFRHPRLVEDIGQVLGETGLAPGALEVEITESAAMGDVDATVRTLEGLKGLGVRLAMDDFGTGYSSLGYLRRFPLDVLKVDRSFVGGLPANRGDAAIVQAVIGLARALGLKAVAEGVETAEQLEELRALGCDQGQGYYFGKPVPTEATEALLLQAAASRLPVAVAV